VRICGDLEEAASVRTRRPTVRLEFWKHRQRGGMSLNAPPSVTSVKPFLSRMGLGLPLRCSDRQYTNDGALVVAEIGQAFLYLVEGNVGCARVRACRELGRACVRRPPARLP